MLELWFNWTSEDNLEVLTKRTTYSSVLLKRTISRVNYQKGPPRQAAGKALAVAAGSCRRSLWRHVSYLTVKW
jgi:hypothetical protein